MYHWCVRHCPHCGRSDRILIGGMVDGDTFHFAAYPGGITSGTTLLVAPPVCSWSDWRKVVVRAPEDRNDPLCVVPWGHVEDSDGNVIAPDEFETIVRAATGGIVDYDSARGFGYAEVK